MVSAYNKKGWKVFDCGCVPSRPKHSNNYGSRWKVYRSKYYVMMKCKDCGRMHHFELKYDETRLMMTKRSELTYNDEEGGVEVE